MLVRRNRSDGDRGATIGLALDALGLVDVPPAGTPWRLVVTALAAEHRLTAYDAAYPHLALERRALLAASDLAVRAAAAAKGIALVAPDVR